MAAVKIWIAVTLFPMILNDVCVGQLPPNYQQTTCSVLQQLASTSTCHISTSCCSKIQCSVFIGTNVLFQVLPCTTPPSVNFQLLQGTAVLYNRTFQHSEDISIAQVPFFPTIHLGLDQGANYSSVTISLSVGGNTIIPSTTIPIDRSQCDFEHPSNSCPALPTSPSVTVNPNPPTSSPCQSLQNIAGQTGTCLVEEDCSELHCTILNQYPADLTIEPCQDPPTVTVLLRESDGGVVLVNETLTNSRTQPVTIGGQVVFDLTVVIEHRDSPDIIVLTVYASPTAIPTNITVIPRTVIPIDRSNCSNEIVGVHTGDIPLPPTSSTTDSATCRTLKRLSTTITGYCDTNQRCNSVLCDINLLGVSYESNLTVLPCLDVPGIQLLIVNGLNGSVVLNRTLTKSGMENITVGGSNLTLNETVLQSKDQSSIIIQLDLLLPSPLPSVPILPRTTIPIDRCDCPNINCATSLPPSQTSFTPTEPIHTSVLHTPTGSDGTRSTKGGTGHIKVTQSTDESTPKPSSGISRIVVPVAMVAGVLLIAVVVVVAAALAYFIYVKRRNKAYGFQRMSFEEVKEDD